MEFSTIKTIACFVPNEAVKEQYIPASSTPYLRHSITTTSKEENQVELILTDDQHDFKQNWTVNESRQADESKTEEIQQLLDLATRGYDVAALSVSVSAGPTTRMNEERKRCLLSMISMLKEKLVQLSNTKVDFFMISLTDSSCFDIRKTKEHQVDRVLRKGSDMLYRVVDSMEEIWTCAQKDIEQPFILSIRFTNDEQRTVGKLEYFDLYHPQFQPSNYSTRYKFERSFMSILQFIKFIHHPPKTQQFDINDCIFIKELSKYLTGCNKLAIFAYLNESLINKAHLAETKACLNFVSSFTSMPVRMLKTIPPTETDSYRILKIAFNDLEKKNETNIAILTKATEKLKNLTKWKETAKKAMGPHIIELKDLKEKLHALEQTREKMEDFLELRTAEVDHLKSQIASMKHVHAFELRQSKREFSTLRFTLELQEFQIEDFKKQLAEKEAMDRIIEANKQQLQTCSIENKKLLDQIQALHNDLSSLNEANENMTRKFTTQKQSYFDIKDQLEMVTYDREKFEAQLKHLRSKLNEDTGKLEEFDRLSQENQALRAQCVDIKAKHAQLQAKMEEWQIEQTATQTRKNDLQTQNGQLEKENRTLRDQYEKVNRMLNELQNQDEQRKGDLQSRKDDFEQDLKTQKEELKAQADELKAQFDKLMELYNVKKSEIKKLKTILKEDQKKIETLQLYNRQATERLEKLEGGSKLTQEDIDPAITTTETEAEGDLTVETLEESTAKATEKKAGEKELAKSTKRKRPITPDNHSDGDFVDSPVPPPATLKKTPATSKKNKSDEPEEEEQDGFVKSEKVPQSPTRPTQAKEVVLSPERPSQPLPDRVQSLRSAERPQSEPRKTRGRRAKKDQRPPQEEEEEYMSPILGATKTSAKGGESSKGVPATTPKPAPRKRRKLKNNSQPTDFDTPNDMSPITSFLQQSIIGYK